VNNFGPRGDGDEQGGDDQRRGILQSGFVRSFSFAGQGVWYVVRTQRNMRVHLAAAVCAIALGAGLRIGAADWACVIVTIGLVLTAEALNTVVEALTDLCTSEFHPLAKIAKDAAAGAVLIASIAAVGVAVAVFVPRIVSLVG
jgi:diacylglycerol kinase (ATP)